MHRMSGVFLDLFGLSDLVFNLFNVWWAERCDHVLTAPPFDDVTGRH